jgi:hypothetical protein
MFSKNCIRYCRPISLMSLLFFVTEDCEIQNINLIRQRGRAPEEELGRRAAQLMGIISDRIDSNRNLRSVVTDVMDCNQ